MELNNVSRRTFIKNSAAATAVAVAVPAVMTSRAAAESTSPNERLRLGFIGVGGRAQTHLSRPSTCRTKAKSKSFRCATCSIVTARRRHKRSSEARRTSRSRWPTIATSSTTNRSTRSCISTPDHWHAKQTIDALKAGKHVYCEKPMTHSVEEALAVHKAWKDSGKVMQVGVQSTSLPVWKDINKRLTEGQLGKVLMYQTSYFRNSDVGQWRYYELTEDMTPKNIDWQMFLGTEFSLAPNMPFDREKFAQWRCYWDFGAGMFTDLFVHRTTSMLKATGLRFPGRVVGAGGIYLEYDDRDVPDVATVVADFPEGVQGLVTATMCAQETPVPQIIRGHFGSFVLGNGEEFYRLRVRRRAATSDAQQCDQERALSTLKALRIRRSRTSRTSSRLRRPTSRRT